MKTNILSVTRLAAAPLVSAPAVLHAQFCYVTNSGAITFTCYTGPGGSVTIPDVINGLPVTAVGTNVFYNLNTLKNVTIGTNVSLAIIL